MNKFLATALCTFLLPVLNLCAQTVIPLNDENDGRWSVDATVNGVGVKTFYTEENWFASMSSTTYLFLYENGYIADADVKGMTVLKMPDGSSTKAASFVLRNLRIGNVIVKDLPTFVITKQKVPLLIGNSAFDCFGEVKHEGDRLLIYDGIDHSAPSVATIDPLEGLMKEAEAHLDAKEYQAAADCFKELDENGRLTIYSEYQYIVVLNILKRNLETISRSLGWLGENAGKSLTLDYWVYEGIGDSYSRMKDNDNAIKYYEMAESTYYMLFSTDEKAVMRSSFKDETLGITLVNLGRLYAAKKNLKKAEHYCAMAAKCGNVQAQEYCEKYRIKY